MNAGWTREPISCCCATEGFITLTAMDFLTPYLRADKGGQAIPTLYVETADVARLVSCWNGCLDAGIETPEALRGAGGGAGGDRY